MQDQQSCDVFLGIVKEKVRHYVLNALKDGKAQKEVLIRDRLLTKTVPFLTLSKGTSSRRWPPLHLKKAYRIESEGDPV